MVRPMRRPHSLTLLLAPALFISCAGFESLYPPRPPEEPGEAIADPTPSRVVLHATVTNDGLKKAINDNLPPTGDGTFPLLGTERKFTWKRDAVAVKYNQGRIELSLHVMANADMPVSSLDIPLDFTIKAEPVITSSYVAKFQSTDVQVVSDSRLVKFADTVADVLQKVKKEVQGKLDTFEYDLKPMLYGAYERVARPVELPLGDANGCAMLKVLGVEAGPTVLADGIEKDMAMIIAPSITIPCAGEPGGDLPPLANVASVPSGPFTVTIPVAAKYDELAKAMTLAFKDNKLYFSKDFPDLYMENPVVYASKDQIVLKLHIAGPIKKGPIDTTLGGDIYMTGHPTVEDNELRVPDLQPTIETSSFLLKLKAAFDGDTIRDQARAALRLDIAERLKAVKDKLSTDLSFGNGQGCLKAAANKIEVSGVHVHGAYLRVYVTVNASASVYMPCPG